jgi:hypothetical protein
MTYAGIFDKYLNGVYDNAPSWLRPEIELGMFKVYDQLFTPVLQEIFPRSIAMNGSQVADVDTEFQVEFMVDPGIMAGFMDRREHVRPRAVSVGREKWRTRLVKEWGPTENPNVWQNHFKAGFLNKANAVLTEAVAKSINRKVEYEITRFAYGDGIADWGSLPTDILARRKRLDASLAASATGAGLSGAMWNTVTSDPMDDIITMNQIMNEMEQGDIAKAFIGPNTAAALEKNARLLTVSQYHVDPTNTVIGKTVKGVTFKKVLGQHYKDVSTNSSKIHYPGKGDVRPDNWTTRTRVDMMVASGLQGNCEWGLFTPNKAVGNVLCSKVRVKQTDVMTPYAFSWQDQETEEIYTSLEFGFGVYAPDLASYLAVTNLSTQTY